MTIRTRIKSIMLASLLMFSIGAQAQYVWDVEQIASDASILYDVAYGNNQFMTFGSDSNIFTSTDGVTWMAQNVGRSMYTGAYDDGASHGGNPVWIIGGSGCGMMRSSTGAKDTWQAMSIDYPYCSDPSHSVGIKSLAYSSSKNQWMAVVVDAYKDGWTNMVLTSTNGGVKWTQVYINANTTNITLRSIASGASGWVAVGSSGLIVFSADGIQWSPQMLSQVSFTSVSYGKDGSGKGLWIASGSINGAQAALFTSSNGSVWASAASVPTVTGNYIARYGADSANKGVWVAVATTTILTSADGATWSAQASPTSNNLFGVVNGKDSKNNNTWIAVGKNDVVLHSSATTVTNTKLVASPTASVYGQPVTLTATVTNPDGSTPPGSVSFGNSACAITLSSGPVTCNTNTLPVGPTSVTAVYSGDGTHASSAGTAAQTVTAASTSIQFSPVNVTKSQQAALITLAVNVVAPGGGTPSGTVKVSDTVGTCTISVPSSNSCTLIPAITKPGTYTVTATYTPGNGNYKSSTATTTRKVVLR